jgi:hypothetical protein
MIAALLDAFEVTGRRAYFDYALELMETAIRRFWDEEAGGFFDAAKDLDGRHGSLTMTRKPFQDSPTAAGNSLAVLVLDRLATLADRPDFREKAEATLALFASKAADCGLFAATYGLALLNHLRSPVEIVVVGRADDERTEQLLKAAYQAPRACKRVLTFEPQAVNSRELPAGLASTLPNLPVEGVPMAIVCEGTTCHPPVQSPEALREALELKSSH